MRLWRLLLLSTVVVALAVAGPASSDPKAAAAKFKRCEPPSGPFYKGMKANGVGCNKARYVLKHLKCTNDICSRLAYRSWTCTNKGDIAFRKLRCVSGPRRIVATLSGD